MEMGKQQFASDTAVFQQSAEEGIHMECMEYMDRISVALLHTDFDVVQGRFTITSGVVLVGCATLEQAVHQASKHYRRVLLI